MPGHRPESDSIFFPVATAAQWDLLFAMKVPLFFFFFPSSGIHVLVPL